jgi:hypothetical protein
VKKLGSLIGDKEDLAKETIINSSKKRRKGDGKHM